MNPPKGMEFQLNFSEKVAREGSRCKTLEKEWSTWNARVGSSGWSEGKYPHMKKGQLKAAGDHHLEENKGMATILCIYICCCCLFVFLSFAKVV